MDLAPPGNLSDGSDAGPDAWSSFKPYDSSFIADGNTIVLKPAFFAEVRDGARVNLTFHFWSGATVTYVVTRSGNRVTGTTT